MTATKAIYGAVSTVLVAFITALLPYLVDGGTLGTIPTSGWLVALLAGLAGGGAVGATVYRAPANTPKHSA
jgi:hypothetical protein